MKMRVAAMTRPRTLFGRLFVSYLAVVLLTVLAVGITLSLLFSHYYYGAKERELLQRGQTVSSWLATQGDPQQAARALEALGNLQASWVVLLDRSLLAALASQAAAPGTGEAPGAGPAAVPGGRGGGWGAGGWAGAGMGMHMGGMMGGGPMPGGGLRALRPGAAESRRLLQGQTVAKRGYDARLGQNLLWVGVPVWAPGPQGPNRQVAGALLLAAPVADIRGTISAVQRLILYAAAIALLFAAWLGFWFSRSLSGPLRQMGRVALDMAEGQFQQRLPVRSEDEVGQLARSFNYLAARLQETVGALEREKGKLEDVVGNLAEGVLAVDQSGQILLANAAAKRVLSPEQGSAAQGPAGGEADDRLPSGGSLARFPELASLFREVLESGQPASREFRLRGGQQFLLAHGVPLWEEAAGAGQPGVEQADGQHRRPYGAVAVLEDITQLRQLDELRRDFVANVSHELRTPLTSIQGFVEALLDGMVADPRTQERYLKVILHETTRLNRLIHDLLDLVLIESGRIHWEKSAVDLRPLLEDVRTKLEQQTEQADVRIQQSLPEGLPSLFVNRDRIEQVLLNLLDNALRYSPPGSVVQVKAWQDPEGERDGRPWVILEVRDEGPGIPPEDLPRLWERFFRVEKSRARLSGGTGLGLAIVKEIVEAHGGRAWVESSLGHGSAFFVRLPAVAPAPRDGHGMDGHGIKKP